MLQTEYFEHMTKQGEFEAFCDSYYLPAHLQSHIHYIMPDVKPSGITGRTTRSLLGTRSGEWRVACFRVLELQSLILQCVPAPDRRAYVL